MGNESWIYQGRQSHGWFGHGTGPHDAATAFRGADTSFVPESDSERIGSIISGLIGHIPRDERARWSAALSPEATRHLSQAMTVWHNQDWLSRDAFRSRFLDEYASDTLADQLRAAARGAFWGRSVGELGYAGRQLAGAALSVGADQWPRFVADLAERAAAGQGSAPQHGGYLRAVALADAPGPPTIRRVADSPEDLDIDVVDARLRALIATVIAKANVSIPAESNPMVFGSRMHKMLADEVEAANIPGVTVEQSFIDGRAYEYGEIGTIRVDVLLRRASGRIVAVWDWKTGMNLSMSPARIRNIQEAVGTKYGLVPIRVIGARIDVVR